MAIQLIMKERGALGSRLHQAEDVTWISYARWPGKELGYITEVFLRLIRKISKLMIEAEEEAFTPIMMTPVADYLT
jgi:hypothetical protein